MLCGGEKMDDGEELEVFTLLPIKLVNTPKLFKE